MQDRDLDDFFAAARAETPLPTAGLIARIEADGLALQQARNDAARRKVTPPRRRGWAVWLASLGGGGVLAGLASVTAAGIWLGVAQPAPLAALTDTLSGARSLDLASDPVDLMPGLDSFAAEG